MINNYTPAREDLLELGSLVTKPFNKLTVREQSLIGWLLNQPTREQMKKEAQLDKDEFVFQKVVKEERAIKENNKKDTIKDLIYQIIVKNPGYTSTQIYQKLCVENNCVTTSKKYVYILLSNLVKEKKILCQGNGSMPSPYKYTVIDRQLKLVV